MIADKDKEVTRVRTEFIRLQEQWKTQVKDRQQIMEKLRNDDASLMKKQLMLRNRILELEKKNEKQVNDTVQNMEEQMQDIKDKGL